MDNNSSPQNRKFIIFKVASRWYAIPMVMVLKIVNCPQPSQGGIIRLGVVQMGSHTIQLLNLRQLSDVALGTSPPEAAPFLVVLQPEQETLWGIALDTPPDLIDLPLTAFNPVSIDDRFSPQSPWISHIAVLPEPIMSGQDDICTLLQLNLKSMCQRQPVSL